MSLLRLARRRAFSSDALRLPARYMTRCVKTCTHTLKPRWPAVLDRGRGGIHSRADASLYVPLPPDPTTGASVSPWRPFVQTKAHWTLGSSIRLALGLPMIMRSSKWKMRRRKAADATRSLHSRPQPCQSGRRPTSRDWPGCCWRSLGCHVSGEIRKARVCRLRQPCWRWSRRT